MGKRVFTREAYVAAKSSAGVGLADVTKRAEKQAMKTGRLEPLVDPSGFGVVRLSLPRVEKVNDSQYELLIGTPLPIETRVDTTGSMGGNVDTTMKVLPDAFDSWSKVASDYDIQIATGIFGDISDNFPLCRPQFEMDADKIVNQLTLMVPERNGGDYPEDPDYGIFAGAYLCRHYINRIGLKGYDFTVTDAPGRGLLSEDQLIRIFGDKVYDKVAENGFQIRRGILQLEDVWSALLDRAHAFILQVDSGQSTSSFWSRIVGDSRIVRVPDTHYLPHVQAVIIGLTEGTLILNDVAGFLQQFNINSDIISSIERSVINIPIGVQRQSRNYNRRPKKGDLFDGKPDVWEDKNLWPVSAAIDSVSTEQEDEDDWL